MADRRVTVVGIRDAGHRAGCVCEACGPAALILFSEYEATRLLDALERRDGTDTGDWHSQVRQKLWAFVGGRKVAPGPDTSAPIPGPDPGACPDCGEWRKAGMVHTCGLNAAGEETP